MYIAIEWCTSAHFTRFNFEIYTKILREIKENLFIVIFVITRSAYTKTAHSKTGQKYSAKSVKVYTY